MGRRYWWASELSGGGVAGGGVLRVFLMEVVGGGLDF